MAVFGLVPPWPCLALSLPGRVPVSGRIWPYLAVDGPYLAVDGPYLAVFGPVLDLFWPILDLFRTCLGPVLADNGPCFEQF